jgi:hypothetical protein
MAKPRWSRQEAAEHRAKLVADAQEVLASEVKALRSGEDWKRFLQFQSRLHAYSPNNVMLVYAQHAKAYEDGQVPEPSPGYVAGFNTWKALGRSVVKGQHGYLVLAPLRGVSVVAASEHDGKNVVRTLEKGETPVAGEQVETRPILRGFKVERVFSEHQTAGEPLPEHPTPKLLEGEAPRGLGEAVMGLIESKGFQVDTVPDAGFLQGANGMTVWADKRVLIRADMDDAAMVKTLIHEAGHCLLHEGFPGFALGRARKEVEAESVAFVVAHAHSMATDGYSFPYVASWASQGEDVAREIAATQRRVHEAATAILEVSPAAHDTGGRVPGIEAAVEARRQVGHGSDTDPAVASRAVTGGVGL